MWLACASALEASERKEHHIFNTIAVKLLMKPQHFLPIIHIQNLAGSSV